MTKQQKATRKPTAAERLAARALDRPDPEEIEVDVTPSAVRLAERIGAPGKSPKPAGMDTATWYEERAREGGGGPLDAA